MSPLRRRNALLLLLSLGVGACASSPLQPRLAPVEGMDVRVTPGDPPRVTLDVRGYLPDACTQLGEAEQRREDHRIVVSLPVERPADAVCAQVIRPYTQTIELEVADLPPGVYALEVNGRHERLVLP